MVLVLFTIGSIAFTRIIARTGLPEARTDALKSVAIPAGTWALGLLVPFIMARLALQLDGMRFPGEPLTQSLRPLLEDTEWGKAWIAQLCFTLLAVVTLRFLPTVAALSVVGIALTFPYSGHAAAVEPDRLVALIADSFHVLSAGMWLGSLGIIALAWPVMNGAEERTRVVRAFSPVALTCAAVLALSGLSSTLAHLSLTDLTTSSYGRTLLIKLAFVAAVLLSGWLNWKRNTARIATDEGAAIRAGMLRELAFAFAVVLVTAVLVSTPPPGDQ